MNNLNSVLLEGKVEADPESSQGDGKATCSFKVLTVRKDQPLHFPIFTQGHLAEVCAEYLRAGRAVRIVGELNEKDARIWILAEHIEFKPEKGKGE